MNYMLIPGMKYRGLNADNKKDKIMDAVCSYFELNILKVIGHKRQREVVLARHLTMFFLKKHTNLSCLKIAKIFSKDHTSVLHACKAISNYIETNEDVRKQIMEIENKILA